MKYKKISNLKFKSVPKAQKEELTQWIIQHCDIFKFFDKPSLIHFLKKLKMEISGEIERRKLFIRGEDDDINKYFYIIKSGNAFSWFGLNDLDDSQKGDLIEKSVGEIKKGMIGEIFCEGDFLYPSLELFENPFLAITEKTKKIDYLQYFTPKKGNILSRTPFNVHIVPLVVIRIGVEEFDNLTFGKKVLEKITKMFLHYLYLKLIINRWKSWGQWTNKTELKILSILYLYFIGELPLQCWVTATGGEEVDNIGVSFKKPKCLIKKFEVGTGNLALFVGVTRQKIYLYFSESEKTIFRKDEGLASLLNCRAIPNEKFKFSSPEPLKLLSYIQSKILSSTIKKI